MKTFQELDLIPPLQRALVEEGYEVPTPIQAQTIPAALDGRDILGCAQTGTGKTAAFALPILNRLGQHNRKSTPNRPRVLVLAPTRELAIQIGDSFDTYGKHLRLRQALVYGGVNQTRQVRALSRGTHILVATPGRLLDLMGQGHIQLDQLEMFVLDEADRMLDMGFLPALRRIIDHLPERRQSLFFSATLPPNIVDLASNLLRDPESVNVTPELRSVRAIDQRVLFVEHRGKRALLCHVLSGSEVGRALVFTKTKRTANRLAEHLLENGMKATAIHGNKSQSARQRALEAFRANHVNVLVATDVAARGLDIDGVTHVVNFDLPHEPEAYVHRIGRTGRAGADGIALSFCTAGERRELHAIERLIGQTVAISPEHPAAAVGQADSPPAARSTRRRSGQPNASHRTGGSSGRTRRAQGSSKQPAHTEGQRRSQGNRKSRTGKQRVRRSS